MQVVRIMLVTADCREQTGANSDIVRYLPTQLVPLIIQYDWDGWFL